LELTEWDEGAKTVVTECDESLLVSYSTAWSRPLLEGRKVYWVDGTRMRLNIWDIDTQEERVIALDYPGK